MMLRFEFVMGKSSLQRFAASRLPFPDALFPSDAAAQAEKLTEATMAK
jgi:hypothetical protein